MRRAATWSYIGARPRRARPGRRSRHFRRPNRAVVAGQPARSHASVPSAPTRPPIGWGQSPAPATSGNRPVLIRKDLPEHVIDVHELADGRAGPDPVLQDVLGTQQLPGLIQDGGGLAPRDDDDPVSVDDDDPGSVDNDDVSGRDRDARALDRNVDVPVARDRGDVGHESLAEDRELELADLLDVAAGAVDHRRDRTAIHGGHGHEADALEQRAHVGGHGFAYLPQHRPSRRRFTWTRHPRCAPSPSTSSRARSAGRST